jgi:flagellar biosynthesis chaperone FliJ
MTKPQFQHGAGHEPAAKVLRDWIENGDEKYDTDTFNAIESMAKPQQCAGKGNNICSERETSYLMTVVEPLHERIRELEAEVEHYRKTIESQAAEVERLNIGWAESTFPTYDKLLGNFDKAYADCMKLKDQLEASEKERDEYQYKLECLLCHASGSMASYSSYSKETMYGAVNDHIERCVEDAIKEVETERDKYKTALERILDIAESDMGLRVPVIIKYAREALGVKGE